MSRPRPRTRPTRDETRAKLLDAAAVLFAAKGIAATSIEDICHEAGFTRGAFYSNFGAKDELVLDLLDLHLDSNRAEIVRLYERSDDTASFIDDLDTKKDADGTAVLNAGMLYMELQLFALRNPQNQPRLLARHRAARDSIKEMIERIAHDTDLEVPGGIEDATELLFALDSGLGLHWVIDPDGYDANRWARIVSTLHRLWVVNNAASEPPAPRDEDRDDGHLTP